jgi:hypothetical protein
VVPLLLSIQSKLTIEGGKSYGHPQLSVQKLTVPIVHAFICSQT